MEFRLHADLDIADIRASYRQDDRTRIVGFLPQESASRLSEFIAAELEFEQAFALDGAGRQASREQLASLPRERQRELRQRIFEQAARGIGYWYGRHDVTGTSPAVIRSFLQWLNDEEVLAAMRDVTGVGELRTASAQVTRFLPGDFLTRHNDVVGDQQRRIAYAYNLSPSWHPDWGGLLQFFRQNGEPRDAWLPDFNVMSLFDVAHVHSVTSVSAFAPAARYAISGWFRTK